uniref:DHHA2 domain-containing protein n=1 Tax=Ciona savignyi TaxID=51511 RepID=H2Y7S7_CIOSA
RVKQRILFQKLCINPENLVFLYDYDFKSFKNLSKEQLTITLVDHHHIQNSHVLHGVRSHVTEILDHRPQEYATGPGVEASICKVGSCSTLIATRVLQNLREDQLLPEVVTLLLGAILIDTNNLLAKAKVTPTDVDVVQRLLQLNLSKLDRETLYDSLNRAKFSVEGFNAMDMLHKDAKVIENQNCTFSVMFSTLHQHNSAFFSRPDAKSAIESNLETAKVQAWISLAPITVDSESRTYKVLAVYCPNDEKREKIIEALTAADSLEIQIDKHNQQAFNSCVILRMYNCQATRKQIIPVVNKLLQDGI